MLRNWIKFGCVAVVACTSVAQAGDLNPPAGPVASTFKTLHEVEPRIPIDQSKIPLTINKPGSYYLTEHLSATAVLQDFVIDVLPSNVTIDLHGFTIFAGTAVTLATDGIRVQAPEDVEIFGGSIVKAGGSAIDASATNGCVVRDIRSQDCGGSAIIVGVGGVIEQCVVQRSGGTSITAGTSSLISACTVVGSLGRGIFCSSGTTVSGCSVRTCVGIGIHVASFCHVVNCTVDDNINTGFQSLFMSLFEGCVASNGRLAGFRTSNSGTIYRNCLAVGNTTFGFVFDNDCTLIGCQAIDNETGGGGQAAIFCSNNGGVVIDTLVRGTLTSTGIDLGDEGQASGCTVLGCGGHGINGGSGSIVERCVTRNNEGDGIVVISGSFVYWNLCTSNGGAGVRAINQGNRIDSNHVRGNASGIKTSSTVNIIVRNSAQINGIDYDLFGGDKMGAITNDPAAAGPWDNFD